MGVWQNQGNAILFVILATALATAHSAQNRSSNVDKQLIQFVDGLFHDGPTPGGNSTRKCDEKVDNNNTDTKNSSRNNCRSLENYNSFEDYVQDKWNSYSSSQNEMVEAKSARFFTFGQGKSSFLAGFGMGFMAFFLKKLLLPVFIIAQIFKSVLIAMFLPSILGSIGKLVGKGLSTVSGVSGSSAGGGGHTQMEEFEFKDTSPYANDLNTNTADQDFNADTSFGTNTIETTQTPTAMNRFGVVNQKIYQPASMNSDNYYIRQPSKKTDYKIFHKIPSSSLLLTSYDPFYSPLLSRLDAVFQQLGLGAAKSSETEKCRERLVCLMYANPAKYAPYSNLVSAQLSRELNELRKPSSDNPEILRFFRYMKAAKDGQDGEECLAHGGCPSLSQNNPSPAMLTTFNDINKLVQARKL